MLVKYRCNFINIRVAAFCVLSAFDLLTLCKKIFVKSCSKLNVGEIDYSPALQGQKGYARLYERK